MVSNIVFWSGFGMESLYGGRAAKQRGLEADTGVSKPNAGIATRIWQLGIEMRPFFTRASSLAGYPIYAAVGASFGYWMDWVDERHETVLNNRLATLKEKRRRQDERIKARNITAMEELSEQARKDRLAEASQATT